MNTANLSVVENVVEIPVSEIEFNWDWNCRLPLRDESGKVVGCSGSAGQDVKGDTEFTELKASIAADGQKTPALVRPLKKPKNGKKYHLVAGYQRCEAISQLAEEGKFPAMLRAIVREMSEREARIENLRENTARSALSGADLTVGIAKLLETGEMTDVEIAARLGKSQGYISKLCNIMRNAKTPALLEAWRKSPVAVPVLKLDTISRLETADEQMSQFAESQKKGKGDGEGPTRGPDAWVTTACLKAKDVGEALGLAAGHGALIVSDPRTFFSDYLRSFVNYKAAPKDEDKAEKYREQVQTIVAAFSDAYDRGFDKANAPAQAAE